VNDSPTALAQTIATPEDTALPITLAGQDVDGDTLSYEVLAGPANGTLSGIGSHRIYVPATNFYGTDQLKFRVSDGEATSPETTVTINVTPVNDPPVAVAQTVTTVEDTSLSITLAGYDVENNPLTFALLAAPAHGALDTFSTNTGALTYTPAPNYHGPDAFTFAVFDGQLYATGLVSVTVMSVNDAPVAFPQWLATPEETALPITLAAEDRDGDPLTYQVVVGPAHGTVSGAGPQVIYVPGTNYSGSDYFTFRVSDGLALSSEVTVMINVTPVNDAPVALSQAIATRKNTAVNITPLGMDADGDPLFYQVVAGPDHGALSGGGSQLLYVPDTNYVGLDQFTFHASDGTAVSPNVVVTINVVNGAPVALAQAINSPEDTALPITLAGQVDGNPLTFELVSLPAHGVLSEPGSHLVYVPATNYQGLDQFVFRATDGTGVSPNVTVTIRVTPVNDAPTAAAKAVVTLEDTPLSIRLLADDVDGNPLTYALLTSPGHGTLGILDATTGALTYTPATNYYGLDAFTFTAFDGQMYATGLVSITVTPVNDSPVATSRSATTAEDTAVNVVLSGSDPEGNPLTYLIVAPPAHGSLSGSAPNLTYRPQTNYNGPDSFTFKVNDGSADSSVATISLTVTPVNDPPVALPQAVVTAEDTILPITLSGVDVDRDPLTYEVLAGPAHGTLYGTSPEFVYVPIFNYHGPDAFTFKVKDALSESSEATIAITVNSVPETAPNITSGALDGPRIILTWSSLPGQTYRVRRSVTLDQPTWKVASDDILAAGERTSWTDTRTAATGFYVVEIVDP